MEGAAGSGIGATTYRLRRLFTCEHTERIYRVIIPAGKLELAILTRRNKAAGVRPFNNLLRRLNSADFALIEPHLTGTDAKEHLCALCRLHASSDLSVYGLQCHSFDRAADGEMDHCGDGAYKWRQ